MHHKMYRDEISQRKQESNDFDKEHKEKNPPGSIQKEA